MSDSRPQIGMETVWTSMKSATGRYAISNPLRSSRIAGSAVATTVPSSAARSSPTRIPIVARLRLEGSGTGNMLGGMNGSVKPSACRQKKRRSNRRNENSRNRKTFPGRVVGEEIAEARPADERLERLLVILLRQTHDDQVEHERRVDLARLLAIHEIADFAEEMELNDIG